MKVFKNFETKLFWLIVAALFCTQASWAFVVPSYFSLRKIAERKDDTKTAILEFRILRPVTEKNQSPEVLWTGSIIYPPQKTSKVDFKTLLPFMPLLVESDPDRLITYFKNAGYAVRSESEAVLWTPEDIRKSENPPSPFYKLNNNAIISRKDGRRTIEYSDEAKVKKFVVEKDSFIPLMLTSRCPEAIQDLSYGASAEDICKIEFDYRNGTLPFSLPLLTHIRINDRDLAVIRIDRVIASPSATQVSAFEKAASRVNFSAADDIVAALYKYILY